MKQVEKEFMQSQMMYFYNASEEDYTEINAPYCVALYVYEAKKLYGTVTEVLNLPKLEKIPYLFCNCMHTLHHIDISNCKYVAVDAFRSSGLFELTAQNYEHIGNGGHLVLFSI